MLASEAKQFGEKVNGMLEALQSRPLTERAMTAWFASLMEFPARDVFAELDDAVRRYTKAPSCAQIWQTLNERRSNRIEDEAKERQRTEKREVENLFAGRTPIGHRALAELRKLCAVRAPLDRKVWANRIMERVADGDPSVPSASIEFARRALRWDIDDVRQIVAGGRQMLAERQAADTCVRTPGDDDE